MEPREYETLGSLEDHFWWYRGLHRLVLERVGRCLETGGASEREVSADVNTGAGFRILDAGCGTGGMLRRLRSRFPQARLVGFDWSPRAVAQAQKSTRTGPAADGIARASVSALPFPGSSFDLVVSLDVLYHAAVSDDVDALREFTRVLRPGGYVVLNLPAFESLRSSHDRAIHTARRYRAGIVRERLERAGLVPVRVHYWNGFLFPALAAVRLLRRGEAPAHQPAAPSDVRPLPPLVNRALELALTLERAWLRLAPLPFGLSVLGVARRPPADRTEFTPRSPAGTGNPR